MSQITTAIYGANIIHEKGFVKSLGKFFNVRVLNFFNKGCSIEASALDKYYRLL